MFFFFLHTTIFFILTISFLVKAMGDNVKPQLHQDFAAARIKATGVETNEETEGDREKCQ